MILTIMTLSFNFEGEVSAYSRLTGGNVSYGHPATDNYYSKDGNFTLKIRVGKISNNKYKKRILVTVFEDGWILKRNVVWAYYNAGDHTIKVKGSPNSYFYITYALEPVDNKGTFNPAKTTISGKLIDN